MGASTAILPRESTALRLRNYGDSSTVCAGEFAHQNWRISRGAASEKRLPPIPGQMRSIPRSARADTHNPVMTSTGTSGYLTDIMVNNHGLVADEPIAAGGTNLGPTPFEYLTAALGACTSMTLRMYADRKQWPLESVKVRLNHQKIPAKDCETCETKEGMVDHFDLGIEVEGPLDEAQLKRLKQIAGRCPVHRTLKSEKLITTELKKQ